MVPLCRGGRLCPPAAGSPYPSVGRDPCVPPHDMHVFLPAGHAGPALQGTGRVRADRVVRPYSGSRSRAKRDVVPQGHLFRCAPLQDAVPYIRLSTAHRSPVKAMDFASCRWQTDDGVPCVRRGGLTMAGHKRCAFIVPSGAPATPYKQNCRCRPRA